MIDAAAPFVLLDDARGEGAAAARLFTQPVEILRAETEHEVTIALTHLREWVDAGAHVAGFIGYEAGFVLEPALSTQEHKERPVAAPPMLWFARFARCERIAADAVPDLLPDADGAALIGPHPAIDFPEYSCRIDRVLEHIRAGDIYQANLTFNATVRVIGSPLAAYARLRRRGRAGYGGVVHTGEHWLLSLSPELFFSLKGGQLMARPMKGTAQRSADPEFDVRSSTDLSSDPKQRAENLMIVDLLRNDLSRIAVAGSVKVPELFRVESYPTVHQMVSSVSATLTQGSNAIDVIERIFPCGSITGAPKISAMRVIGSVEDDARGIYTGAIGFFGPDGEAAFNVAIRTLALRAGETCATLGLGSGIVADSTAGAEWQECLAKGEFVRSAGPQFDLIETMMFDPMDGIVRLDGHIARLSASAREFGYGFDRHEARNRLQHATFRLRGPARVRLRLSPRGSMVVETGPLPLAPATTPVPATLVPLPVDAGDLRLRHKTSNRRFYDDARKGQPAFEVIFTLPDGSVTEGSFTNLFVERDGALLTPPAHIGLLPGVLRQSLIDEGRAREARLTAEDLSGGFLIGNSLRGLIPAALSV